MPQWDLLDFIAGQGRKYPTFDLRMSTEATGLTHDVAGRVSGVTLASGATLPARLVIAADGRRFEVDRDRPPGAAGQPSLPEELHAVLEYGVLPRAYQVKSGTLTMVLVQDGGGNGLGTVTLHLDALVEDPVDGVPDLHLEGDFQVAIGGISLLGYALGLIDRARLKEVAEAAAALIRKHGGTPTDEPPL